MSEIILETERLQLRCMSVNDRVALTAIWSDAETMSFYPQPLAPDEIGAWIERNIQRHLQYGGGLWAIDWKESGETIGDCGLLFQNVDGHWELEVGYHVNKRFWRRGIATEAARACRDYGFEHYPVERIISLIRPENTPSRGVAGNNGMQIVSETIRMGWKHYVYAITRTEWHKLTTA